MSAAGALPFDPPGFDDIGDFGQRIRSREITVTDATAAYFAWIEALEGSPGDFEHVAGEMTRAPARDADAAYAARIDPGLLTVVPIGVKDLQFVEGASLRRKIKYRGHRSNRYGARFRLLPPAPRRRHPRMGDDGGIPLWCGHGQRHIGGLHSRPGDVIASCSSR